MALGKSLREIFGPQFAEELAWWQAYEMVEPFGDMRADLRMGILASVCAGPWVKENAEAPRPADFMPFLDKPPPQKRKPQTVEQQKTIFDHLQAAARGRT